MERDTCLCCYMYYGYNSSADTEQHSVCGGCVDTMRRVKPPRDTLSVQQYLRKHIDMIGSNDCYLCGRDSIVTFDGRFCKADEHNGVGEHKGVYQVATAVDNDDDEDNEDSGSMDVFG